MAIWVFAEASSDGKVSSTALEILTKARELGEVEAVVLGPGSSEAAKTLGEYGAKKVYASDDAVYADYVAQPAAYALWKLAEQHQPEAIFFAMDYDSRDIAARVAASMGSTIMGNATDLLGADKAQTQIFGGEKVVDVALNGSSPKMVIVRPKSFEASPSGGTAEVEQELGDLTVLSFLVLAEQQHLPFVFGKTIQRHGQNLLDLPQGLSQPRRHQVCNLPAKVSRAG